MSAPRGSNTPGSLRQRMRELLSDGVPRTAHDISRELGEPLERIRHAIRNAKCEGEIVSALKYALFDSGHHQDAQQQRRG